MAISTSTNTHFVQAQKYENFIVTTLPQVTLPEIFWRNVSEFENGTTLNVPRLGAVTLQDLDEDNDPVATPISSSNATLTITNFKGDRFYITKVMEEDGYLIPQLVQERAMLASRTLKEKFMSTFLEAVNDSQTAADLNTINGYDHRWTASGTAEIITYDDIKYATLAADEANWPEEGRVAIWRPKAAYDFKEQLTLTTVIDSNPQWQDVFQSGISKNAQFKFNVDGWDIYVTTLIETGLAETTGAGGPSSNTAVTAGYPNFFMSVADSNTVPMMGAWRRMPMVDQKYFPEKNGGRTDYFLSGRWGWGNQRVDTLITVLADNP